MKSAGRAVFTIVAALAAATIGCRDHMPHAFTWPAGGDITMTHPKPPEGGYYSNWDPWAVELVVTPIEDVNPVRTQHYLVATVKDKDGKPLPNRRIEWMINQGSVGDIVEVDSSGWSNSRGYKVANNFAVSHTNNWDHVLTMGTDDPSDDIQLKTGDSWVCITSPVEGETYVTVYAPGIYDTTKHKVFALKKWYDVKVAYPPAATNPTGTTHTFSTKVMKNSNNDPLAGYTVNYKILDGPDAVLEPGGGKSASVVTDGSGEAKVTIRQTKPAEGTNNLSIEVIRPDNVQCCKPGGRVGQGKTAKTWIGPKLACTKTGPTSVLGGENITFTIDVSDPSQVDATNVVLVDTLPDGLTFVSSNPSATAAGQTVTIPIGTIKGGERKTVTITAKGNRSGTFENCAEVKADMNLVSRCCAKVSVTSPKLAIEKKCTPEISICDTIEYVVTVRNPGDGPAKNVVVTDAGSPGVTMSSGQGFTATIPVLNGGESKEFRYTGKVSKPGSYENKVMAKADGGLTAEAACRTVVRQPVLEVSKTATRGEAFIGRPVEFSLTVTNKGDMAANNTVLRDPVPSGVEFVSATDGGALSGGAVTWNLGSIAPGASKKVSIVLKAVAATTGENMATATAVCAEASAKAPFSVKGVPALLLEVIDVEDPIEVGANITYQITVTNQGTSQDTNIRIECTLPDELDFVRGEGPTKSTASGKKVAFEPYAALAPKARITYTVVCKGLKTGDLRFKTVMRCDSLTGGVVEETESTHVY